MDYFTADTHFGHANILEFCKRPFGSPQEMDGTIIAGWNQKVNQSDAVYHLGDLTLRDEGGSGLLFSPPKRTDQDPRLSLAS